MPYKRIKKQKIKNKKSVSYKLEKKVLRKTTLKKLN